jgi:hypothetical protein
LGGDYRTGLVALAVRAALIGLAREGSLRLPSQQAAESFHIPES